MKPKKSARHEEIEQVSLAGFSVTSVKKFPAHADSRHSHWLLIEPPDGYITECVLSYRKKLHVRWNRPTKGQHLQSKG